MVPIISKIVFIFLKFLLVSFFLFISLILGFIITMFIVGIIKDIISWTSPCSKRVAALFVIKKNFLSPKKPIKINMIISFTTYKIIRKYQKERKQKWGEYFMSQLKKLSSELSKPKYKNKIFYTKTHTTIKNKIYDLQKNGNIKIIKCEEANKRYLYETLKFPLKEVYFYKITFKVL